jgi:hypothetical protein
MAYRSPSVINALLSTGPLLHGRGRAILAPRQWFAARPSTDRAFSIHIINGPPGLRLHDQVQVAIALEIENHVLDALGVEHIG